MAERQKRNDPDVEAAWLRDMRRILAAEPGSARAAMKAQIALERGCHARNVANRFTKYMKQGDAAAEREERSDAGMPRGGRQYAEMQIAWQRFVKHPDEECLPLALQVQRFQADYCDPRGLTARSLDTMRRWLKGTDERHGMTSKEAKRASTTKQRIQALYSNQVWIGDQRVADVFVREPDEIDPETGEILTWRKYRPTKFTLMDVRSTCPMGGLYYRDYTSATVEHAIIDSIYPDDEHDLPMCGVAEGIWWDKGKQHWSDWMLAGTSALGIRLLGAKSAGGEPTHHGLIEGYHRILKDEFETGLPGYCGGNNRPENQPLALRLVHDDGVAADELLTLEELNEEYLRWNSEFVRRPCQRHGSADRASRLTRWRRDMTKPELRDVPDRADLGWAFMRQERRKVTREGHIIWNRRAYNHPLLGDWGDVWVQIRTIDGWTGAIWVTYQNQLVCIAEPVPDVFVGDNETVKHVVAAHKRGREVVKDLERTRGRVDALRQHGLITEEAAEAVDAGLREAEVAIKPGRTVQVDVEKVTTPPSPHQQAGARPVQDDVIELHPKPRRRRLPKDVEDDVTAEVLAGYAMAAEAAQVAEDEDYGMWR